MTLNCFYTDEPPKGSRFVAIFGDGAGANLFLRRDGGEYFNEEGEFVPDFDWFTDAGYLHYILLPDDYTLWFERCFVK